MDGSSHLAPLSLEAAELEYQCLLAERAHFDAALAEWNFWRRLGLAIALLSAATTGSAMEVVGLIPGFGGEGRAALTGGFALLLALCTAAFGFLDPKGLRDRHDTVGKRLAGLRAEVRLLRRDMPEVSRAALDALLARHAEVVAEAPSISNGRHQAVKAQLASNVHYKELRALTGRAVPQG
jgi:hypothetical protein